MYNSRALAATVVGAVIGGAAGYLFFTEHGRSLRRQLEPALHDFARATARLNAILDDMKAVSSKVKEETERVDQAIHSTMGRIDDTAGRVRSNVRAKTSRVVGFVRGLRVALEGMLHSSEART